MKGAAERRDLFQTLGKRSDESPVRRVRSAWISQPISAKLHSQTRMLDHREIPLSATFGVMSGPVSEKSSVCPEQDHEPSRLVASLKVGRDSRRPIASDRICATKKRGKKLVVAHCICGSRGDPGPSHFGALTGSSPARVGPVSPPRAPCPWGASGLPRPPIRLG
jgi:hypothetical protein